MGLLGDIFSQGDRAKRYLRGLLSEPVASIEQTAGLLGDFRRQNNELYEQAFGNPNAPLRVTDPAAMGLIGERILAGPLSVVGAISPQGKARLLADLQAGKGSGTYRLGDVTEGQAAGLDALFGRPSPSRDVFMSDTATDHLLAGRVQMDGFTPEEVVRFAEQAMAKRSRPDLNLAKENQNPSLLGAGLRDPVTGRPYAARMPFRQVEGGYEVRSVVPEGLDRKNNKAPKR